MTSKCKDCDRKGEAECHDQSSDRYDHEWKCGDCNRNWRGHDANGCVSG